MHPDAVALSPYPYSAGTENGRQIEHLDGAQHGRKKAEPLIAQEPGISRSGGGTPRCVFSCGRAWR